MKKITLLLASLLAFTLGHAQISDGFSNDFEDGTTQGWSNGGSSPNPPTNVPDGGPGGVGDGFLEEISGGGAGPGSRMIVFNENAEWLGNYETEQIETIQFDAEVPSDQDLQLRVAMAGGSDETEISSTVAVTVPAQSTWSPYTFFVTPSDFTIINGSNTVEEVLQDVIEIRILHSDTPSFIGQSIDAVLHLDNIAAFGTFGVDDVLTGTFKTFPNPTQNELHLRAEVQLETYTIYNLLGAKVAQGSFSNTEKTIDVSSLLSGAYIIEVTAEGQNTSRKFIKQ